MKINSKILYYQNWSWGNSGFLLLFMWIYPKQSQNVCSSKGSNLYETYIYYRRKIYF